MIAWGNPAARLPDAVLGGLYQIDMPRPVIKGELIVGPEGGFDWTVPDEDGSRVLRYRVPR